MSSTPLASFDVRAGTVAGALDFLKRTRSDLRTLRRVRVWIDRVQVFDVNGDYFEVQGVGYPDADVTTILDAVNGVYNRETIAEPTTGPYKEFLTGRRYPWAQDRVM